MIGQSAIGFRTILMDPPWEERGGGKIKRGADRHYRVMSKENILKVIQSDECPFLTHTEGCHLWVWATSNHLNDAMWMIHNLGFRYVTDFVWLKDKMGLGQYRRSRHELLLLGRQGESMLPEKPWPSSVIEAPRREHSRKPDEAYAMIEHISPMRRLELFARAPYRADWHAWGDQGYHIPHGESHRPVPSASLGEQVSLSVTGADASDP